MASLGLPLAIFSALAVVVAALSNRFQAVPPSAALLLLGLGLLSAGVSFLVGVVRVAGVLMRGAPQAQLMRPVAGVVLALVVLAIPLSVVVAGVRSGAPAIHDISTDTVDPPLFVDMLSRRVRALNPAEYGGPDVAAKQRQAYPDLTTIAMDVGPDAAFDRVLAVVRAMGWELVTANHEAGRIEATDTTPWFGFKDDVVVRVRPGMGGSRVDIRSLSRVGGGDVGTNARRIREFRRRLMDHGSDGR